MRAFTLEAVLSLGSIVFAQVSASPRHSKVKTRAPDSAIVLHEISRKSIASEIGGAFMFPSSCDADGNLYIRKYATDRPLLSPVVKIDAEGKRVALFDSAAFSQLKLDRADAFGPSPSGGLYQIATAGIAKPQPYVLRFSPDGSPESPIRIDDEFHPYQFTPFANGNLLVSGARIQGPSAAGYFRAAVFSPDGRLVSELKLKHRDIPLAFAEPGTDGNIYAMRHSLPVLFYVIAPTGDILRKLRVPGPSSGAVPQTFHVSANRLAVLFWDDTAETETLVVTDAQTGRRIASYSDPGTLGPSFACYAADEGVFTFLHLGEGNTIEVVRAQAH